MDMKGIYRIKFLLVIWVSLFLTPGAFAEQPGKCEPTRPDMLGPFYKPGAPVRSEVGKGYVLTGAVKSSLDCSPVEGAKIEFWLTGPEGYDDAHRATVFSGKNGGYRFESNFPEPYAFRPPHIHIKVSAQGYRPLVTQHYPETGNTGAVFDLVLVPEEAEK
jgi:protocatechuate 3,4-dioxygenase beta subunit